MLKCSMNGTILLRNISMYLAEFIKLLRGAKLPVPFVVKKPKNLDGNNMVITLTQIRKTCLTQLIRTV